MRTSKPWYWAKKKAWYVQPKSGKQIRLGRHPVDAPPPSKDKAGNWNVPDDIQRAYHQVMAVDPAHVPETGRLRAIQVCDLFLDHSHKHHSPDTYQNYQYFLQSFVDLHGQLLAADIRPMRISSSSRSACSWS